MCLSLTHFLTTRLLLYFWLLNCYFYTTLVGNLWRNVIQATLSNLCLYASYSCLLELKLLAGKKSFFFLFLCLTLMASIIKPRDLVSIAIICFILLVTSYLNTSANDYLLICVCLFICFCWKFFFLLGQFILLFNRMYLFFLFRSISSIFRIVWYLKKLISIMQD